MNQDKYLFEIALERVMDQMSKTRDGSDRAVCEIMMNASDRLRGARGSARARMGLEEASRHIINLLFPDMRG